MQQSLQHTSLDERREFQRLRLDNPVTGTFGTTPVVLVEAGVLGARIQHATRLDGSRGELRFSYRASELVMRCEVVRTSEIESPHDGIAFTSGVRFLAALGDSGDRLREMLAHLVTLTLERRYDTSPAHLRLRHVDGDQMVRGTDAHFVTYRLENTGWRRRPVFLPEQPTAGFTVARVEDSDEMQRLCAVYEASDAEGRRLIRLFAELSVSDVLQIPPSA